MTAEVLALTLALPSAGVEVDAAVHEPDDDAGPAVLLVPGAGGTLASEGIVAVAEAVAAGGFRTVRANLPHHQTGRRPPRAEAGVPAFSDLHAAVDARWPDHGADGWVVGGRSYGARVASLAVAAGLPAAGLLCVAYPLHAAGRPERPRVEHWPEVGVPSYFLQGDHDALAELDLLRTNRRKLPRRSHLEVVVGGDHSLRITARRSPDGIPRSPTEVLAMHRHSIHAWLTGLDEGSEPIE